MSGKRRVRFVAGRPDLRERNVLHLVRMSFDQLCFCRYRLPGATRERDQNLLGVFQREGLLPTMMSILVLVSARTGMAVECLASDLRRLEHAALISIWRNQRARPRGLIVAIGSTSAAAPGWPERSFADLDPCPCCGNRCLSQLELLKPGEAPHRFCAGCDPGLDEHEPGSWRCPCREAVAS
jgi:hypothetical protein